MTTPQTYSESAKGVRITRRRAIAEIESHGLMYDDIQDFLSEYGDHDTYAATQVLEFIGY